jgi:hypothetical protein
MMTGETTAPSPVTHAGNSHLRPAKSANGSARSAKLTAKPAATTPDM